MISLVVDGAQRAETAEDLATAARLLQVQLQERPELAATNMLALTGLLVEAAQRAGLPTPLPELSGVYATISVVVRDKLDEVIGQARAIRLAARDERLRVGDVVSAAALAGMDLVAPDEQP